MKTKLDKNSIPQDFSLRLALVDGIPVILFSISMILLSKLLNSYLFLLGSILCLMAGICKVLWKIIVVLKRKNIWFLFIQMRIIMPLGLIMMIVGFVISSSNLDLKIFISFPAILFFIIGIIGMSLMFVFAFTLDGSVSKNNWIEQITNIIAQLAFLIGLILII